MNITDAYSKLYRMAESVAMHLGIDQSRPGYNPMQDDAVLEFMEQAITTEIGAESQQVRWLDELDKELP